MGAPVCSPAGAARGVVAPAPTVLCAECAGVPHDPDSEPVCGSCNGCGLDPVTFALNRTRTHGYRICKWEPGRNLMTVTTAVKPWNKGTTESYSVVTQPCDWSGKSLLVAKIGSKRLHTVYIGPDEVRCTCEGFEFLPSAKANQRAYEAGEETYPTFGCKHVDSLAALVAAGWL